jgi:aryl-alcohol dehydrogenase-like predicted oxidoreductase
VIGLALAPWKVLAGGKLRTDAEEERRRQTGEKGRTLLNPDWERNEDEKKMAKALEEVAKQVGTEHITAGECDQDLAAGIGFIDSFERAHCTVAIAYVLQKTPYVFPIIGGRKVEHMLANVEALSITLTLEQISFIENVIPFDPGFPHTIVVSFC